MTDDSDGRTPPPGDGAHPSAEELSAHLDGERTGRGPAWLAGHLDRCDDCAALLGELTLARMALNGLAVSPAESSAPAHARARAAAVAAALEAAGRSAADQSPEPGGTGPSPLLRLQRRERRMRLAGVAAAVALVAAVGSGLGLLVHSAGSGTSGSAAPSAAATSTPRQGVASRGVGGSSQHGPALSARPSLATVVSAGSCGTLRAEEGAGTRVVTARTLAGSPSGCLEVRNVGMALGPADRILSSTSAPGGSRRLVIGLISSLSPVLRAHKLVVVEGSSALGRAAVLSARRLGVTALTSRSVELIEAVVP